MPNVVLEGDCLSVMPTLVADSIDAVICDPPYGLKFMGKEWDHGVPGVPFWTEAIRVAKPGAYLLAFGGTRTHHRLMRAIEDAGWEIRDCLMWLHGQGFPKGKAQLKPAWEPIVMARKKGTLQPLNIDGCRIEALARPARKQGPAPASRSSFGQSDGYSSFAAGTTDLGRWPANLILDEEAAAMLDEQTGELTTGVLKPSHNVKATTGWSGGSQAGRVKREFGGNSGGASRFFYTSKASRAERGEGNHHPTVKPLDLMQWLCRLVTPKSGLILDPFCGSGTTGRAAVAEGFSFIGIELSPEYAAIARARIAEYAPLFGDVA